MITKMQYWRSIYFFAVVCKNPFFWYTIQLTATFLGCAMVFTLFINGGYLLGLMTTAAAFVTLYNTYRNRFLFYYPFRRDFKIRRHMFWYLCDLHPITYGDYLNLQTSAANMGLSVIFEEPLVNQLELSSSHTMSKMKMEYARVLVKDIEIFTMLKLMRGA